jgi:hypothetical protein
MTEDFGNMTFALASAAGPDPEERRKPVLSTAQTDYKPQ